MLIKVYFCCSASRSLSADTALCYLFIFVHIYLPQSSNQLQDTHTQPRKVLCYQVSPNTITIVPLSEALMSPAGRPVPAISTLQLTEIKIKAPAKWRGTKMKTWHLSLLLNEFGVGEKKVSFSSDETAGKTKLNANNKKHN